MKEEYQELSAFLKEEGLDEETLNDWAFIERLFEACERIQWRDVSQEAEKGSKVFVLYDYNGRRTFSAARVIGNGEAMVGGRIIHYFAWRPLFDLEKLEWD